MNIINRPSMPASRQPRIKGAISGFLCLCVTSYLTMFIVNGALPQFEMFITGGKAPISGSSYTILFGIFLVLGVFFGRFRRNSLLTVTMALSCYCIMDLIFLVTTSGFSFKEVRGSFEGYFIPLIFIGLAASVPMKTTRKQLAFLFGLLSCACVFISALQYSSDSAILPIESTDGRFVVPSDKFGSHQRAFSLFHSGLDAGVFYCLMAAFGTSMVLRPRRRLLGIIVVGASVFGCYATYTRLTMLSLVACVISVIMMQIGIAKRILVPWLPVVWLLVATLAISQAGSSFGAAGREDLSNTSTMAIRIYDWNFYRARFAAGSTAQILFGRGVTPFSQVTGPDKPATSAPIPIDNGYLEVLLHSGVIGLLLVVLFFHQAWGILYRRALAERSSFVFAAAALFAVFPLLSSINDLLEPVWAVLFLTLCLESLQVEAGRSHSPQDSAFVMTSDVAYSFTRNI